MKEVRVVIERLDKEDETLLDFFENELETFLLTKNGEVEALSFFVAKESYVSEAGEVLKRLDAGLPENVRLVKLDPDLGYLG